MSLLQRITLPMAAAVTVAAALATILAALAFEHIGGYAPCAICLIERYAYYAGIPLAGIAFFLARSGRSGLAVLLLGLCGLGFLINTGIGIYHSGIEWKWWPGPQSCGGGNLAPLTGSLLDALENAHAVACDEAPWRFAGLSFTGWNTVISLGLAALSFLGVRNERS